MWIGAALALAAASLVAAGALHQLRHSHGDKIQAELDDARKDLQARLDERLALVRGLAAFVQSGPDFTQDEFHSFSSALLKGQTGIRSLQLAPAGVIRYLTQPELNREAIGFDLLNESKYREVLREAIPVRTFHVAGPVDLIQGGRAFIGRLSVHLPEPEAEADRGTETFWGFATVLIDPEVLTEGLASREAEAPTRFALRVAEDHFAGSVVVYGEADAVESPTGMVDIQHPSGRWELTAYAPLSLASAPPLWLVVVGVGFGLAGLLGLWVFWLLRRPAELSVAVEEATAALRESESRLLESRKFEALGQLTGGMAHDFNNILAVVQGNLELIGHEGVDRQAAAECIAMALEATQKGASLTRSLLSFASRQSLEPRHCELDGLIESIASLLNRTLGPGIAVRTELDAEGQLVHIDPSEFETTLLQLAVNAKHAMPQGGTVWVRTTRVDHIGSGSSGVSEPHVLCTISDNGVGMSEAVLEHAFEPFFTTRPGIGSGLGLSMIYGFVNQSEGDIEIKSQVDGGTTVRIYLPVAREDALRDVVIAPPGRALSAPKPPSMLSGRSVLVAEDHAAVRRVVVAQLRSFGLTVLEAKNALDADKLHRMAKRVDLLLTDILMPGGASGFDLAERVQGRQPDVAVAFMSGYEAEEVRPAGLEGPMLHKPFEGAELQEALEAALRSAHVSGAGATIDRGRTDGRTGDRGWAAAGVSGEG